VRDLKHVPGTIMLTDYSVNTMNLAIPDTQLASIGLQPIGLRQRMGVPTLELDDQTHLLLPGAGS
jgi:hypothetical protein